MEVGGKGVSSGGAKARRDFPGYGSRDVRVDIRRIRERRIEESEKSTALKRPD